MCTCSGQPPRVSLDSIETAKQRHEPSSTNLLVISCSKSSASRLESLRCQCVWLLRCHVCTCAGNPQFGACYGQPSIVFATLGNVAMVSVLQQLLRLNAKTKAALLPSLQESAWLGNLISLQLLAKRLTLGGTSC